MCNAIDSEHTHGVLTRYVHPVLSAEHIPLSWRFDLDASSNPHFLERLGINSVFNPGAIHVDGMFHLVARVEGVDRKSFFAIAKSASGIDNFRFVGTPLTWEDRVREETNMYDMRLCAHEDGYIYGIFCSEHQDPSAEEDDTTSACAHAGLVRTKDLRAWQRLPNIETPSPQQRNVVLHPEFVEGKYAFYTRPQPGFIAAGSGISFGLADDIDPARIREERLIDPKIYHTVSELKNGQGPPPLKTPKGWIHIAHGVRETAAGLRYVLYAFATDLKEPWKVIAKPGGYLLAPRGKERIGDVGNVVFCNGALNIEGTVYIYYASSDTRSHVATTSEARLLDYVFNTPPDALRSLECVEQRLKMIEHNASLLKKAGGKP